MGELTLSIFRSLKLGLGARRIISGSHSAPIVTLLQETNQDLVSMYCRTIDIVCRVVRHDVTQ
jgi:hypothetical protein